MKKGTVIAIVIVVAVAAYLIWKRVKGNGAKGTPNVVPADSSLTETQIIDQLTTCPQEHIELLRYNLKRIYASPTWKASVERQAEEQGVPFSKMAVINAAFTTYYKAVSNGGYEPKYTGADRVFERIKAEVMGM